MCCNLQTHTKVISSICLFFTGIGALNLISTFGAFSSGSITVDADLIYGGSVAVAITVQILIYTSWIASDVCCLVGAIKNNKCLLIPFMIKMSLTILFFLAGIIICLYYALLTGAVISATTQNHQTTQHVAGSLAAIYFFLLLVPLFIGIGISIYFLTIVVKYYKDLSSGVIAGQSEGIVLQPYSSQPMPPNTGVATVYVPPGSQVYQHPPAYNPGMQQPV